MKIIVVSNLPPHPPPSVGCFWGIHVGLNLMLLCHGSLAADIRPIEGFIDHERGHADIWEEWQRMSPTALAQQGIPLAILSSEYDQHPRGRLLMVDTTASRYVIYADRTLQNDSIVSRLRTAFGVSSEKVSVQSDSHYRT